MRKIEEHIGRMNSILPFRVAVRDFLPSDINPKAYARLRSGANGWVDPKTGDVCLYKPNLVNIPSKIESQVAFLRVSRFGIKEFMGEKAYRMLCLRFGSDIMKSSSDKEEIISLGDDYLTSLGPNHNEKWDEVAKIVGDILGFKGDYALAESLCKGNRNYHIRKLHVASSERNFSDLSSVIRASLDSITDNHSVLSLGKASEVFERLGYPDIDIRLDAGTLRNFVERHDLDRDSLFKNFKLFSLQDPLGVFRSHVAQKNGKEPYNLFVSDHYFPGRGYLTFGIESVNDVFKGVAAGKYQNIKVKSLFFLSEYSLMQAVCAENGRSIQYLQPKFGEDGSSYRISDFLRRMEGRTAEDLGYKRSAGGTAPGLTPLQQSHRLRIAANIVENFKNPISVAKRIQLYGKNKFESMADEMKERVSSMSVRIAERTEITRRERTYKERLNTRLDSSFTDNARRNLNKAGIFTAMDIMSMGEAGFREKFGIRVYKAALKFLEENRLGFKGSVKIRVISEASIEGKAAGDLHKVRCEDFINSLVALPENVLSRSVRMPRNADGVYFSGVNAVNLIAKTASLSRWRDCNVFLNVHELSEHGMSVMKGAIPCHLSGKKGNHEIYYNLAETDYAVTNPSLFDKASELSRQTSAEVPDYIKNLLYGFSGVPSGESVKVYDFIDKAYKANVSTVALGPESMTLKQVSAFAARDLNVRNPLERRGRKARPKDVLNDMMRHNDKSVVESKQKKRL